MEHISKTIARINQERQMIDNSVVLYNGAQLRIVNNENYTFISRYQDQPGTPDQVKQILDFMFLTFKIFDVNEQKIFVSSVLRAKMSLQRLKDSVNNIIDTFKAFPPKPADIVNFDNADDSRPIYTAYEIGIICQRLRDYHFNMDLYENIIASTDIYNRAKTTHFINITNAADQNVRDKNGTCIFSLTEKGTRNRKFLEELLNARFDVEFHDNRIQTKYIK